MKRVLTQILILATVVVWILYDIFAFLHWGNPSTISAVSIRYVTYVPGIAFAFGVLVGHIFFNLRDPITWGKTLDGGK
jgi:hypothetical protein